LLLKCLSCFFTHQRLGHKQTHRHRLLRHVFTKSLPSNDRVIRIKRAFV
jgi:hypothetical protein